MRPKNKKNLGILLLLIVGLGVALAAGGFLGVIVYNPEYGIPPDLKTEAWNGDGIYIGDTESEWNRDDLVLSGIVHYKVTNLHTASQSGDILTIESITFNVYEMLATGGKGGLVSSSFFTETVGDTEFDCYFDTSSIPNGEYFLEIIVRFDDAYQEADGTATRDLVAYSIFGTFGEFGFEVDTFDISPMLIDVALLAVIAIPAIYVIKRR